MARICQLFIKYHDMPDKNNKPADNPNQQQQEVYNRPGSNEHNDFRIQGDEVKKKDEKESYMDYNGNSEENDPNN
jgi:hypothetical protein